VSESFTANKEGLLADCSDRAQTVDHLPIKYGIHLNEPCNQACIMCEPTGRFGRRALPFESFVALFDQIKPFAEHITLIGGETFMYPKLPEALEFVSRHPVAVTINTNAVMLNDRVIPGLLSLHELNLKWSIDAATRRTYHKIRGRDHFDRVVSNLRRFAELSRDRPNIRIISVFVVMRENFDEVLPFIDFVKPLTPYRVEFHPVKHVRDWSVENGTGWAFKGSDQVVESFRDEYNDVMRQAAAKCDREGLGHDCQLV
jgi:MoaA/NifB/PqqE/SkfB family radical SAM enzyme